MRRLWPCVGGLVCAVGLLVGCASVSPDDPGDTIRVELYQTRHDVTERVVEIAVTNHGDEAITVTSAVVTSERLSGPAAWAASTDGATIMAGHTVDLRAALPPVACAPDAESDTVSLGLATADGEVVVELPAPDRYGQLAQLQAQECAAMAVTEVASVSINDAVEIADRDGTAVILVPLSIAPTGADGSVVLGDLHSTVLLSPWDAATAGPVDLVGLGMSIAGGDAPSTINIATVPGRCDPHAVAEDKQGTRFILDATAPDGSTAQLIVVASDAARSSIYAAIATLCGFPTE